MARGSFLDVFKSPAVGKILSAGPGSGPSQSEASQTSESAAPGIAGIDAPDIPPNAPSNATGYGGNADTVEVVPARYDEQGFVHGGIDWMRQLEIAQRINTPTELTVPRYNEFYDTLATGDNWKYVADAIATGTILPAATGVSAAVAITETIVGGIYAKTSQYPGGVQLHIIVHTFSATPRLTTQTGSVLWTFTDAVGSPAVPLGTGLGNATTNGVNLPKTCRNPSTDAGLNNGVIGNVNVTTGGGATFGTWDWQLGVALAYKLPAVKHTYLPLGPKEQATHD